MAATASASAIKAGEAFVSLEARDVSFSRGLDRAKAKLQQVGADLRRIGAMGVGLGVAMAPVVATFAGFDDAMRAVRAKTGATAAEFDRLTATAKELGRTTSFTAAQVAELMVELGTAGFNPDQINVMTGAVLDLARATRTDAKQAAEILGATLNQFGMGAEQAATVADRLAKAEQASATTLASLGETLQYFGPVAQDIGLSVEETLALAGGLAKVGIKGSEAGTALRRISLLATTGAADLERLFGVSGKDAAGNARPIVDILEDIHNATKNLPSAERAAKLTEAFGLLGVTGASSLGKLTDTVRDLNAQIAASDGVARQTAKDMDAGLGGSWRMLRSAAEGSALAIGESLAPALMIAGMAATEALGKLTKWISANQEAAAVIGAVVVVLTAMAVAAGVAGVAMFGLGMIAKVVTLAVGVLTGVLALGKIVALAFAAALASPLAVAGLLAAGVVAAVAKMSGAFGTLGRTFGEIGGIFKETFGGILAALKKGELQLAFDILTAGLHAAWLTLVAGLREAWHQFTNYFRDAFNDAVLAVRVAFLDMLIGVVDGINRAAGALKNLTGPAVPKEVEDNFKRINAPTQKRLDEEAAFMKRQQEKLKALGEPKVVNGKMDFGPNQEAADAIIEAIKKSNDRMLAIGKEVDRNWAAAKAGDKFIDVRPFEQAKKELADLDRQERDARDKRQAERLAQIRQERDAVLARMRELTREAMREVAPMPREAVDPRLAPMPRAAGRVALAESFGQATRGLFESADFRGALAVGPAAQDVSKQQLGKLGDIKNELGAQTNVLRNIERKVEPAAFG